MANNPNKKLRFHFIDQFRGFIVVLMLVDHCSYYLNAIWKQISPYDPLFDSWGQFALRYSSYFCAPGFLMMAGAMVWWSHKRRIEKGFADWKVRWQLIQRGFFLILLQMTWVNSSWGGFAQFKPWHLGIIASIGVSLILLTLIVKLKWYWKLIIASGILLLHPFLLKIPYNEDVAWQQILMQTFIDAGSFNKYPVLPWFAMAILGAVMAKGWLEVWKTDNRKIIMGLLISAAGFIIAFVIRYFRGFGNLTLYSDFGTYSYFFDQKYPPSLYHLVWFFAACVLVVTIFIFIGKYSTKALILFTIPGRVPLFFYGMHIALLGVFSKRLGYFYREGGVEETLIGVAIEFGVMIPLCIWFYRVKRRSNNFLIKMI